MFHPGNVRRDMDIGARISNEDAIAEAVPRNSESCACVRHGDCSPWERDLLPSSFTMPRAEYWSYVGILWPRSVLS